MEQKIKRLSKWRQGSKAPPTTIEINPTNRCNLKCKSCWQRAFKVKEDRLCADKIFQVAQQALDLGVSEFRFPGAGEPLLKPGLFQTFELIKQEEKEGQLITNGTLITEDKAERFIELGWDCLTISLDSPQPQVNDYLRGKKGAFEKTQRALMFLQKYKRQYNSEKPLLRLNMVLSNRNYDQLSAMIRLAANYGVDDLQVQPMTVWGELGEKLKLDQIQRKEFKRRAREADSLAEEKGVRTNLGEFYETELVKRAAEGMEEELKEDMQSSDDEFLSLPCFEPFYNLVVFPDGRVGPCSISGGKDGDSVLEKNLEEIWYYGSIDKVRESLLNHDLPDYCQSCCSAVNLETKRIKKRLSQIEEDEE